MSKLYKWFSDLFLGTDIRLRELIAKDVNEEVKRLVKVQHVQCDQYVKESETRVALMQESLRTLHMQQHKMMEHDVDNKAMTEALNSIAQAIRDFKNV